MSATLLPATRRPRVGPRELVGARVVGDTLALVTAFLVSYALADARLEDALEGGAIAGALLAVMLRRHGLYRPAPSVLGHQEIGGVMRGVLEAGAAFSVILYVTGLQNHPPVAVFGGIALAAVLVPIARRAVMALARALVRRGLLAGPRVLIAGAGRAGRLALQQLVSTAVDGPRVVGFLDDLLPIGVSVRCRVAQNSGAVCEAPVLGRVADWARIATEQHTDVLLVSAPWVDPELTESILRDAASLGMRAEFIPDLGWLRAVLFEVGALGELPLLRVANLGEVRAPRGKRVLDVVGAALLIVLTAPLWAIVAVLVRLSSPGPVFFVQERVGRGGRTFRMWKFRTMRCDVDPYALSPAADVHPGITRVGRVLRVTGLDELPQLLNVLRGDMSLVGPRPEMPFIVEGYTRDERQRLYATPGVTGVWQLSPDRHAQIHEHVEHDLYYVCHQSLLLDVLVLFETLVFTASVIGKRIGRRVLRMEEGEVPRAEHDAVGGNGAPPHGAAGPEPGAFGHASAATGRNGAGGAGGTAAAGAADTEGYALIALDQRQAAACDHRWSFLLPRAVAVARGRPVKVLAAHANVSALDSALMMARPLGCAIEYVPYRSREQLRRMCTGARVVLTDLPHVAQWARNDGVEVIRLPQHDAGEACGEAAVSPPADARADGESDIPSAAGAA